MAAKVNVASKRSGEWSWHMLVFTSLILFLATVPFARAQDTTDTEVQQGTVETRTIIGIEQGGLVGQQDPAMRALLENQRRLEEAIFVLEDRIAGVAAMAAQTEARLSRGDEPLVALEIEQLWVQIRSLEQENAVLREALMGRTADEGE